MFKPNLAATKRFRLLGGGVLVSLACASAMAQPMAGADGQSGPGAWHGAMHRGMGPGPGMEGMLPGRLLDQVGVTDDQKGRIRDIFKAARQELRAQREAQRGLQAQMARLLAAPQLDAAAAEALRQQMLVAHDATSRRMLQAKLDAGAVLSAAQRAQLAERMAQRRQLMQRHHEEMRALDLPRG